MFFGSASVVNDGSTSSDYFRCSFRFATSSGSAGSVSRVGGDAIATVAANLVVQEGRVLASSTKVTFVCGHDQNLPGGTPRVDHAQITAIRTDNLTMQSG